MARLKDYLLMLMLVVPCAISNTARAEASAIAFGSEDGWGWATRNNQQEANSAALKFCNEYNQKKDCALKATKAVVRAEGGGGRTGYARSYISLADAKKVAIKSCGNASCKVTFEMTKPGFYSLAKSETDENGKVNFHLTYKFDDSDEVDKQAKQRCESAAGRKCSIIMSGAIPGIYKLRSAPSPSPVSSEKNCRPNTPTVRCSSQCANGNCIVSYENGCKIRVQVQPRFDSFNNQWTYPSPSC